MECPDPGARAGTICHDSPTPFRLGGPPPEEEVGRHLQSAEAEERSRM